jgi:hypothetical protein
MQNTTHTSTQTFEIAASVPNTPRQLSSIRGKMKIDESFIPLTRTTPGGSAATKRWKAAKCSGRVDVHVNEVSSSAARCALADEEDEDEDEEDEEEEATCVLGRRSAPPAPAAITSGTSFDSCDTKPPPLPPTLPPSLPVLPSLPVADEAFSAEVDEEVDAVASRTSRI